MTYPPGCLGPNDNIIALVSLDKEIVHEGPSAWYYMVECETYIAKRFHAGMLPST